MKLIDRYILRTFMVPLTYCLLAFTMLFVIFDLFENLSNFMEARTPATDIIRFYAFQLPSVAIYIVPVSLLLAVLYSLTQLTRHNELTAMRASGINLYRLMIPFVAVSILASIITAFINERTAPDAGFRAQQFLTLQRRKGDISVYIEHNLPYANVRAERVWHIQEFDTRPPLYPMRSVRVIQQSDDGTEEEITAGSAEWQGKHWRFYDLKIQRRGVEGDPKGSPERRQVMDMTSFDETPSSFINELKDPEFLSAREIGAYIRRRNLSQEAITRLLFDMHYRLAIPWTCLIVTLIGIPFGAHTGRKGVLAGIALILCLFFAYYATISLGMGLGKRGFVNPAVAAWTPHLLFLCIGLYMAARMR